MKSKGKRIISLVVVIALITVGLVYNFNNYSLASETTTLEPTNYDETGIDVSSDFVLNVAKQRDLSEIKNGLTVSPNVKYEIADKGNGEYIIKLHEELKRNSIYIFNLRLEGFDSSWAFQTQKEFGIVGTLPRDKSQGVPVNSGIEIVFTHREVSDIENYFEITPKIKGRYEYHKNTVVFVPEKLEPETIYTVKIKKGLELKDSEQKLNKDLAFQFETNRDYKEQEEYIDFTDILPEFSTYDNPVLNVVYYDHSRKSSEEKIDKNINVNIYKYKSYEDFINVLENDDKPYWSLYSKADYSYNLEKLELISSFNIDLVVDNNNKYLMLPETLEEGYYLVEGKKGKTTFQTHIQITNISAYYSESESKNLIWVHNLENKKPIKGAKIETNDEILTTNENGIAVYDGHTEDEEMDNDIRFLKISKDNMNPLILSISPQYQPYNSFYYNPESNEHLSYVFLDRGMYKPQDFVNVWGIVKSLKDESIDKLTVILDKGYGYSDENYLMKKEVYLKEDGTFDDQFKLPNLTEGYYNITIKIGDKIITNKSIQIKRYVKPEYKLEISSNKNAIFLGEDISFDIEASFFEGTPVSNLDINYNIDGIRKTLTTNNGGKGSLTYTADSNNYSSANSYYEHRNLFVNSRLPEIADITANHNFYVYTKNQMITTKSEIEDNKGKVIIGLNNIDLTKINNSENQYNYHDTESVLGEPVGNKDLKVRLIKHEWNKIEDGVEYDFINKTTVKKYRYENKEITVETKSLTTDKNGEANYEFNMEEDGRYTVEVSSVDSEGRQISQSVYVTDWIPYYHQSENIELKSDKDEYSIGEEVKLRFLEGDNPVEHSGEILFITAQNGMLDYTLKGGGDFKFNFQQEHIPNLYVHGIAFNGKTYKTAVSPPIKINPLDKELKIEINPDKDNYKPGEEVTLDINVYDKLDNPVKARVNISIVDEAFFSLREQNVDILNDLFSNIPHGITRTYTSHNNKQDNIGIYRGNIEILKFSEGANMDMVSVVGDSAGDGGIEIRSEFKDTALFRIVETDEEGKGQVSFTLPHNITEWRVTYQGVNKELNAGDGYVNISATLPFFTEVVMNNTYLEGDKPTIAVNSHGMELEEGEAVEYEISVPSLGINKFEEIKGAAFTQAYYELPQLTLGEHKVIVKAKSSKGYEDGLEKIIKVVPTYHTEMVNEFYELNNSLNIKGSEDGITTLVFSDLNRGKYYYDLGSLRFSNGVRIDQRLSSEIAKELLEVFFEEEIKEGGNSNLYQYQLDDGGISLLPYSQSELELTAKIADLAQDKFDKALFLQYFDTQIEEGIDEAVVLYAKASLGEPVLNQLNILSQIDNLSVKEKLYMALGYEKSGHKEGALQILTTVLRENGESNEAYYRINKGIDKDDILEVTSLAMVLAARLNIEEKDMLYEYVKNHHGEDILVNLEKLMYLEEEINKLPDITASFKCELDNDIKEISLENGMTYRLSITPENLDRLIFSEISGNVAVNASYEKVKNDFEDNKDKYASIRREYFTLDGEKTNTFNSTDIVKVVIYPNIDNKAFNGTYEVIDILPAGLKPIENFWNRVPSYDEHSKYPWDIEGQKVKFYTYTSSKYKNRPMVYYARVISKGEYNCERAVIKNTVTNDTASYTDTSKIIIK